MLQVLEVLPGLAYECFRRNQLFYWIKCHHLSTQKELQKYPTYAKFLYN